MKLKKRYPKRKKKKKDKSKIKIQSGRTMKAIKKMVERKKFGRK